MKVFSVLISIAIISLALSSCSQLRSPESGLVRSPDHLIRTQSGVTQGESIDGSSVVSWFDIPFAQPPVGDLRWRAPRPLVSPEQKLLQLADTACVQKAVDLPESMVKVLLVVRIAYISILKRRQILLKNNTQ